MASLRIGQGAGPVNEKQLQTERGGNERFFLCTNLVRTGVIMGDSPSVCGLSDESPTLDCYEPGWQLVEQVSRAKSVSGARAAFEDVRDIIRNLLGIGSLQLLPSTARAIMHCASLRQPKVCP